MILKTTDIIMGGSMDFQQSRTYQNIREAYNWKLQTATLYSLFADRARQEDYIEIGNIYDILSRNEREHARIWWRQLNNGILPTTADNLNHSIQIENESGYNLYREYAQIAEEEGYAEIAALFSGIANIELDHSITLQVQYENVLKGEVHCKPTVRLWICMQCGNILSGECAPETCPVCGFPQGYYRVYTEHEVTSQ